MGSGSLPPCDAWVPSDQSSTGRYGMESGGTVTAGRRMREPCGPGSSPYAACTARPQSTNSRALGIEAAQIAHPKRDAPATERRQQPNYGHLALDMTAKSARPIAKSSACGPAACHRSHAPSSDGARCRRSYSWHAVAYRGSAATTSAR